MSRPARTARFPRRPLCALAPLFALWLTGGLSSCDTPPPPEMKEPEVPRLPDELPLPATV